MKRLYGLQKGYTYGTIGLSSERECWIGTTQPYRLYIVRFFSSRKSSVTTISTLCAKVTLILPPLLVHS